MRAAAAAGLAAQPVAFADPHVTDADGDAKHADPVANNPHHDAHPDINPADPDAARTDIGTSHDQPGTDNDGQRHRGHSDPFERRGLRQTPRGTKRTRVEAPPPRNVGEHHCKASQPAPPLRPGPLRPRPRPPPRRPHRPHREPRPTPVRQRRQEVPNAAQVSLCVEVARAQSSIERGKAAQWTVSAWTKGRGRPRCRRPAPGGSRERDAGVQLRLRQQRREATCDLGAMDAKSAQRQLQARLAVAATASAVKSVRLTAIVSAAHLPKSPEASETVTITAPPPATRRPRPGHHRTPDRRRPETVTSPLPVGSLPAFRRSRAACPASLAELHPEPGRQRRGPVPDAPPEGHASPAQQTEGERPPGGEHFRPPRGRSRRRRSAQSAWPAWPWHSCSRSPGCRSAAAPPSPHRRVAHRR